MGDAAEERLAPEWRSGFEEHLAACTPCRNYFEQLRLTRQALRLLPPDRPRDDVASRLLHRFREHFRKR